MIKNIRALAVIGAMVLFPVAVFAEDVPMTEEEVCLEDDYAIEAQTEEEVLIVAEEDEFLEEDGLVSADDEEYLEAAVDDWEIEITEKNFPDENFRNYIKENYSNNINNTMFYLRDTSTVTEMDVRGKNIGDLRGIEYFSNLKKLKCENNNLTSLDVRGFTSLERLSCNNNQIANLDVSGCTSLNWLYCDQMKSLESLDVSGCTSLMVLICNVTSLTSLDVSTCTNLQIMQCYGSLLTSLDISGCILLSMLDCSYNSLTSLDISSCTSLKRLDCCKNPLQTLDVSFCPNLKLENLTIDDTTKVLTVHEHVWDGGRVTKKATSTAEGVKTYTCKIAACGQTKTEKIPKLKSTAAEKITVTKKPSIKKPAAKKTSITVNWKHFKHTSKKAKKIWKKIKKVQVQCATDSGFKNIVKDVKIGRGKTKYAIKGLKKKTTYYVRVRYFDGTGYSNWSKVKKIKTKK